MEKTQFLLYYYVHIGLYFKNKRFGILGAKKSSKKVLKIYLPISFTLEYIGTLFKHILDVFLNIFYAPCIGHFLEEREICRTEELRPGTFSIRQI